MQLIPILPLSPSAKLLTMPTSSSSSSSSSSSPPPPPSSSFSSSKFSLHLPFTVGKIYLILTTLYLVVTNVTGSSNDAFINGASIASSSLSSDSPSSSIPSSLLSSSLPSSSESSPMVQFNSPVAVLTSSVSSSSSSIRNSNINKRSASNSASSPGHSTSNTVLFKGDAIIESETLTPGTTSMSVFEGDAIILTCKVKSNESETVDIQWRVQPEDLSDEPSLLSDFGINDATINSSIRFVDLAAISNAPNRIDGTNSGSVSGSGANGGVIGGGSGGGRSVSGDRDQQHQQQQSKLKITESQLYIKSATYSHRAHYYCQVDRPTPVSQQPRVLIRIKDRLAALWPFLGIVGEVVILCTVIFIYESKRSKPEEEDLDDTSASSPTRSAPGHSSTKCE